MAKSLFAHGNVMQNWPELNAGQDVCSNMFLPKAFIAQPSALYVHDSKYVAAITFLTVGP